jgi:hypothetical protein
MLLAAFKAYLGSVHIRAGNVGGVLERGRVKVPSKIGAGKVESSLPG